MFNQSTLACMIVCFTGFAVETKPVGHHDVMRCYVLARPGSIGDIGSKNGSAFD